MLVLVNKFEEDFKIWIFHLIVHVLVHFLYHCYSLYNHSFNLLLCSHAAHSQVLRQLAGLLCLDVLEAVQDIAEYLLVDLLLGEMVLWISASSIVSCHRYIFDI